MADRAQFEPAYTILLQLEGDWGLPDDDETYRGIKRPRDGGWTDPFWISIDQVKRGILDKYRAKGSGSPDGYFQTAHGILDYRNNLNNWNNWFQHNGGMIKKINDGIPGSVQNEAHNRAQVYWNVIQAKDLSQNLANNLFDESYNGGFSKYKTLVEDIFKMHGIEYKVTLAHIPDVNKKLNEIESRMLNFVRYEVPIDRVRIYLMTAINSKHHRKIFDLPSWLDRVGIINLSWKEPKIENFVIKFKKFKIKVPKFKIIKFNESDILKYLKLRSHKIKLPKIMMGVEIVFFGFEKNLKASQLNIDTGFNLNISTKINFPDIPEKMNEGVQATKDSAKKSAIASVAVPAQKLTGDAASDAANWASAVLTNKPASGMLRSTLINGAGAAAIEGASMCASGGLISKPTLAMIAEAGQSEAVIPLANLRTDPSRAQPDMEIGTYSSIFAGVKSLASATQSKSSNSLQYLIQQQKSNRRTGLRNS
jgi:hypothetical protein